MDRCPTCDSPAPHLHPAVQYGGEVEVCGDTFHQRETPENRAELIYASRAKQAAKASPSSVSKD